MPLEATDPTALMQVINQLHPLVIVDESHHARRNPSKQMLQNFNPCFVLDLTATPTKESNIISIVDAIHLKRENMVKLPVIVMNRNSQQDVLHDAIEMQRTLEIHAKDAYEKGGSYIRPIVLFTITGAILRNAVIYAAQLITSHRQEIDALNVFPVPDGDTGTNMSMTITNASREVRVKDDSESVSAVASCVASGLLRGARGNSGVILSLIFRGISKGLKGLDEADGAAIASALEHGM